MAKRGETRPWRVRFEWGNGVAGASTHTTLDGAMLHIRQLREASHAQGASIAITVTDRETGRTWTDQHDGDCEATH